MSRMGILSAPCQEAPQPAHEGMPNTTWVDLNRRVRDDTHIQRQLVDGLAGHQQHDVKRPGHHLDLRHHRVLQVAGDDSAHPVLRADSSLTPPTGAGWTISDASAVRSLRRTVRLPALSLAVSNRP